MTHYIGIDPATHCGWAVLTSAGERVSSGTWDLSAKRHEGGGMRYVRVSRYLRELLNAYPGAHLAYEEVGRHRGVDAAHVYGGIVAMLAGVCEELATPYMGILVGTVKKTATGKGNADKDAMIAAARERWKYEPVDDNDADALWIAESLRVGV